MIEQSIISQNAPQPFQDVPTPELKIEIGVGMSSSSVYWFIPYLASDFPEITTYGKKWIFIWSSDHGGDDKGVFWGDGDSLSLEDFEERGKIQINTNFETPILRRFASETRKIYLYVHAGSGTIQATSLFTMSSGYLHDVGAFVSEGKIITEEPWYGHTGYYNNWLIDDGSVLGLSYLVGATLPSYKGIFAYSTLSSNGKVATVGKWLDNTTLAPSGFYFSAAFGEFFKIYGQWWWIGTLNSNTTGGADACLGIAKANGELVFTEFLGFLNNSATGRTWSFRIEPEKEIAYCYQNNKFVGVLFTTFNLKTLQKYL